MKLIACNSNIPLARAIAENLEIKLCDSSIRNFSDKEIFAIDAEGHTLGAMELSDTLRQNGARSRPPLRGTAAGDQNQTHQHAHLLHE